MEPIEVPEPYPPPDERTVVLVRDFARAMVELELLQRREGTVPRLRQLQPAAIDLVRLVQDVAVGLRLSEVGQRDQDDAGRGEERAEDERCAHVRAGDSAPS